MNSQNWEQIREYIGDPDQVMPVRDAKLQGGFADGVRMLEAGNGGNLAVTVLPDRCMDIYQVRYKGKNLNYISPAGIAAPAFYNSRGDNWLRGFFVGMLTTCGLQNIGGPVAREGLEERGLHGRIAHTPAENFCWKREVKDGKLTLALEGTMREARLFGENLSLHRRLEMNYEEDSLLLTDTICNHGYQERPFLYALHLNYGYPLLEEGTQLILNTEKVVPRTEEAARYVDTWQQVEAPSVPYPERCYFHTLAKDGEGMSEYTVFNEKRGLGVNVRYSGEDLPYFTQWKMLGKGEYVMGMEPMNSFIDGPKIGEEGCLAPVLAPQESKTYTLRLSFIDHR